MPARPARQAGGDIHKIMNNLAGAVTKGQAATVNKAAQKAKRVHEKAIRKVAGSDSSLSGVGKAKGRTGGRKIGVKYTVKKGRVTEAVLKPTGPIPLIENDTPGRVIRSAHSKGRGRRGLVGPGGQFTGGGRGGKAVLNLPGIGYRRSARHPGTKGQQPWAKGRKAAEPVIKRAMSEQTRNIVKGAAGL